MPANFPTHAVQPCTYVWPPLRLHHIAPRYAQQITPQHTVSISPPHQPTPTTTTAASPKTQHQPPHPGAVRSAMLAIHDDDDNAADPRAHNPGAESYQHRESHHMHADSRAKNRYIQAQIDTLGAQSAASATHSRNERVSNGKQATDAAGGANGTNVSS